MYTSLTAPGLVAMAMATVAWTIPLAYVLRLLRLFPRPWAVPKADLRSAVAIVTGSNTGIGFQTAMELCRMGATVVMANRSEVKTEQAVAEAKRLLRDVRPDEYPFAHLGKLEYMHLDLSDLKAVRQFAAEFKAKHDHLDILVNNAGLNAGGKTKQGFENQFCVNFLGHFMLTSLLIDLLRSTTKSEFPEGRIVNLSSVMHHFGQPNVELTATGRYAWWHSLLYSYYSDSKLFMHLFSLQLNLLYNSGATFQAQPVGEGQRPVVAVSANPGFVRSDIWRTMWKPLHTYAFDPLMRAVALTTEQACTTSIAAALVPSWQLTNPQVTKEFYDHSKHKVQAGGIYDHPLIPYFVPYYVPSLASVVFEIAGPFAGPQRASVHLPPNVEEKAAHLWQFCERAIDATETTSAVAEAARSNHSS